MTTVTDVVFGAASDGSQGDTVRTGFTKVNQNTQALNAGKADLAGAVFTGPVTTPAANVGDGTGSANLALNGSATSNSRLVWSRGGVNYWQVGLSPTVAGSDWLIRYLPGGTGAAATALQVSNATGLATFAQRPVFGTAVPWDSANFNPGSYAPLNGATLTNVTINGGTFTARPTFAGATPWDKANLVTPLDGNNPATARDTLAIGGRVLIASVSYDTNASTGAFVVQLPTGYDSFEIEYQELYCTAANTQLMLQISADGGSTWLAGASQYTYAVMQINASTGGAVGGGQGATSAIGLSVADSTAGWAQSGTCKLFRPFSAAGKAYKFFQAQSTFLSGNLYNRVLAGHMGTTGAYNAFRLYPSAGSWSYGIIKVYGIK